MINFQRNTTLNTAMRNLMLSMMDMDDYLSHVLDYNAKVLTPTKEKELKKIMKKYNIPTQNLEYDLKVLTDNPYYKNIKLDNVNYNSVRYEKATIKKRTLMSMDFYKPIGKYLFHYDPIGYFDTDITLPVLKEGDNKVWMSPAVSETLSMKDGIEKGHGKCLTMGLGIGEIPYLWLQKDNVESVTIVEFNQDVIDLFEKYIQPQFKTNKKINIIHGDAFDYYNEDFLNEFDYVYIDFWESSEDGLEYYIKLMEKRINMTHIDYWIEDSILYDVKCILASYLFTLYSNQNIIDFINSLDDNSRNIAEKVHIYFSIIDDIITTEEELLHIIHDKNILRKILAL